MSKGGTRLVPWIKIKLKFQISHMQRNKLEEILQATFDAALAENLNINNTV